MNNKKEHIVLLHGLLGGLSNFEKTAEYFGKNYVVHVPTVPLLVTAIPRKHPNALELLISWLEKYIADQGIETMHLGGNSLGGQIAQMYTLKHPQKVRSLILTGSAGSDESDLGTSFVKRGEETYIREQAEKVFFDKKHVTRSLIDEILAIASDYHQCLQIIKFARASFQNPLTDSLNNIHCPVLLVWGEKDVVTPVEKSAKIFERLLPNNQLYIIRKCGHVPMMERPEIFNRIMQEFLSSVGEHSDNLKRSVSTLLRSFFIDYTFSTPYPPFSSFVFLEG